MKEKTPILRHSLENTVLFDQVRFVIGNDMDLETLQEFTHTPPDFIQGIKKRLRYPLRTLCNPEKFLLMNLKDISLTTEAKALLLQGSAKSWQDMEDLWKNLTKN
ncbi:MAG: hypothetical protein BGO07_02950 [Alphaproteobacteria bacterium 40-19]|nr:MAG: hypothetical protein BGO07_02950 [Alphaproteobacteria bacterium 40-19]